MLLIKFIVTAGLIGSIVSLGAMLSEYHYLFELLSHFRIQYLLLILIPLSLSALTKSFATMGVLAICLGIHLCDVVRSQYPLRTPPVANGSEIRVMSSNLLASNHNFNHHIDYIKNSDPDLIVFQEYTRDWQRALSTSLTDYKYKVEFPISSPFGIALYSKIPITSPAANNTVKTGRPSVDVIVSAENFTLRVIGTHPPPPISQEFYLERNAQFRAIAEKTQRYTSPLVLLGDLNVTPWSNHFREFIKDGALYDGRRGFGILPTWPAGFLPLQVPIDHVLVNSSVYVVRLETSKDLESDHNSIWADLRIE